MPTTDALNLSFNGALTMPSTYGCEQTCPEVNEESGFANELVGGGGGPGLTSRQAYDLT